MTGLPGDAPVFDRSRWFEKRYITRARGGFTIIEMSVIIVTELLGMGIVGLTPLPFLLGYLLGGVWLVGRIRRIKTDGRRFSPWLTDQAEFYLLRRHPHLARRKVANQDYTLPGPQRMGGFAEILREGDDDERDTG